jgi:hypothetical protein
MALCCSAPRAREISRAKVKVRPAGSAANQFQPSAIIHKGASRLCAETTLQWRNLDETQIRIYCTGRSRRRGTFGRYGFGNASCTLRAIPRLEHRERCLGMRRARLCPHRPCLASSRRRCSSCPCRSSTLCTSGLLPPRLSRVLILDFKRAEALFHFPSRIGRFRLI